MFFAPLSELYGRRVMYVSTLLFGLIFIIPCAVSKNIATLLVCRAIDGIGFRYAPSVSTAPPVLIHSSVPH